MAHTSGIGPSSNSPQVHTPGPAREIGKSQEARKSERVIAPAHEAGASRYLGETRADIDSLKNLKLPNLEPGQETSVVHVGDYREDRSSGTLEGILRQMGYTTEEIYAKDESGKTLLERVAESNGLEDANKIQPGQALEIPIDPQTRAFLDNPSEQEEAFTQGVLEPLIEKAGESGGVARERLQGLHRIIGKRLEKLEARFRERSPQAIHIAPEMQREYFGLDKFPLQRVQAKIEEALGSLSLKPSEPRAL